MDLSKWTGVWPAAVTPFDPQGRIDELSIAKLLAYFEAAGCRGAVLAGTNGEGPSLSAVEKRELLKAANLSKRGLGLILGIATASLTEAHWLCEQSAKHGASAVLLMPPGYFRSASESGIEAWFVDVLDRSPLPVIVYNYPKMTGIRLEPDLLRRLDQHPQMAGVKDSSGERENLGAYRDAVCQGKALFVGDESILMDALEAGWTGTISGAANVTPQWISKVVAEWGRDEKGSAMTAFRIVEPVIKAVRQSSQPSTNKAVLHSLGVIGCPNPRLPLLAADPEGVLGLLKERLGITKEQLGLAHNHA